MGVDPDVVQAVARQIAAGVAAGVQVAIVVGGGNFFRGAELQRRGMDRARADYMGMLGTVMNCLALQDFLEKEGVDTRVQTAIAMAQVAEAYLPLRAIRHLEKGRVVIFGAGAGMPYFSTDTVAAQRALEIGAQEVLVSKNGVDAVYTADPRTDPGAQRLDDITFDEALKRELMVVDQAAFSLCKDNALPTALLVRSDLTWWDGLSASPVAWDAAAHVRDALDPNLQPEDGYLRWAWTQPLDGDPSCSPR